MTLILYSIISINKWLKLSDFRQNIDCFCSISPTKIVAIEVTAELLCVSGQHTAVFRFLMDRVSQLIQWPVHKDSQLSCF